MSFESFRVIRNQFDPSQVYQLSQQLRSLPYNPQIAAFCSSNIGKCIEAARVLSNATSTWGLEQLFFWTVQNLAFVYDFITQVGVSALGPRFHEFMLGLGFTPREYANKQAFTQAVARRISAACDERDSLACSRARSTLLALSNLGGQSHTFAPSAIAQNTQRIDASGWLSQYAPWLAGFGSFGYFGDAFKNMLGLGGHPGGSAAKFAESKYTDHSDYSLGNPLYEHGSTPGLFGPPHSNPFRGTWVQSGEFDPFASAAAKSRGALAPYTGGYSGGSSVTTPEMISNPWGGGSSSDLFTTSGAPLTAAERLRQLQLQNYANQGLQKVNAPWKQASSWFSM